MPAFFTLPGNNQRSYGDGMQSNLARLVWHALGIPTSLEDISVFKRCKFAAFI